MDKITSKSSIRPELAGIFFTPEKMVATDGYRLVEVKKAIAFEGGPRVVKAKGFRGRGAVSVDANNLINDGGKLIQGELVDAEYPDYEKVCFSDNKPKFTMYVNAKLLAELLAEVDAQANNPFHKVRLDFHGPLRPLVIAAKPGNRRDKPEVSVRATLAAMTA